MYTQRYRLKWVMNRLVTIRSMAKPHFGPLGHLSNGFQGEKTKK